MTYQQLNDNNDDSITVKILGKLIKIQAVRDVLKEHFKIVKSTPLYENEKHDGYHTFITLKEVEP